MRPIVHRTSREQDAELAKQSRDATSRAQEILKQNPTPDRFLGRKTQDPFPSENKDDPG